MACAAKKEKVTQPVTRELKTFLSWGKSEIIKHQVENFDGKKVSHKFGVCFALNIKLNYKKMPQKSVKL